jgi:hypothetical protein
MAIRGALPGRFACVVAPSRRNSTEVLLLVETDLLNILKQVGRHLAIVFNPTPRTPCKKMTAGVKLNGRAYKQGDRQVPHSLTHSLIYQT